MDNFEPLCYHCKEVFEHEWGPIKTSHYANQVVCAVTEAKYLCIFEDREPEPVIEYLCGLKGRLDFVKYLQFYDLIFVASKFEFMTLKRDNLEHELYHETNLDIRALEWNPPETGFVAWTKENELVFFAFSKTSFTLQCRCSLDAAVPVPIIIGWGSGDAQFQGAGAARHQRTVGTNTRPQIEETDDEPVVYNDPPYISWRGSGDHFVVNYSKNNKRYIRVFNVLLEPLHESEPYPNLGPSVSFMGFGQSIACFAIDRGANKIVIFEKNCKVKEDFYVPQTQGLIKQVKFHPQSNIIAIVSEDSENKEQYITLYFNKNHKWYLKQEIYYPTGINIYDIFWVESGDVVFNLVKLIVVTDNYIEWHTFRLVINRSPQDATVVVIDGKFIEFSKFDYCITPPPCFYTQLEHSRPINQVHFNPSTKQCLIIDSHLQTEVFDYSGKVVFPVFESEGPKLTSIANIAFIDWTEIYSVEITVEANIESRIEKVDNGFKQTFIMKNCNAGKRGFAYHLADSKESKHAEVLMRDIISRHDYDMKTPFGTLTYRFWLTTTRDLYVEGKIICRGVTSYHIYKSYLLFTHLDCHLYTVRLTDVAIFEREFNLEKFYKRPIEQGSRILTVSTALPPAMILQQPRGNLEIIGSAMVTIDQVEIILNNGDWGTAMSLMRDQRINWNVLIELNPDRLLKSIKPFVMAARKVGFLAAIVQEFNPNECVFNTIYKNLLPNPVDVPMSVKLDIIEAILKYLINTDCVSNFYAIVAIQQKHISLQTAMKSIQELYDISPDLFSDICHQAISTVLITDNVKDVLDVAYNLHDLEFVLFVYQCTSEDPRVYEREIEQLEHMDDIAHLKFEMCVKGHNPKNAVKYLLRYDEFDEGFIENFIILFNLEKEAYNTIDTCHLYYFHIIRLYAKSLSKQRKYQEAAVVFMRAGMYEEAIDEYRLGLDWREVIRLMTVLKYDEVVKRDVLGQIADSLIKEKRVDEAVILLEYYNKDYKKTIKTLMDFKAFRHAICLAESLRLDEELPRIADALSNYLGDLKGRLLQFRDQFERYTKRLKLVRKDRRKKFELEALGIYPQYNEEEASEIGSLISSTPSTSSGRSHSSTSTARNRRKMEKKKIDLKEGGKYEDIALMRALYILYTETFLFGNDIREICLITHHVQIDQVFYLHDRLNELQKDMKRQVNEIWPEVFVKNQLSTEPDVMSIIHNREELDPRYREPPLDVMQLQWQLDMYC